jgi:hypothetical protein
MFSDSIVDLAIGQPVSAVPGFSPGLDHAQRTATRSDQLADQFATEHYNEHTSTPRRWCSYHERAKECCCAAIDDGRREIAISTGVEMILNDRFQMLREARIVILSAAVLVAVVGGLLASVELTHAVSPIAPRQLNLPECRKQTGRQESRQEGRAKPKSENADDSAKPTKSAETWVSQIDGETDKPIAG